MSSSHWIERGPDGLGYRVKSKPAVPSLRQKLAEAFHDLRHNFGNAQQSHTSSPQLPAGPAPTPISTSQSRSSTPKPRSSIKQKQQPQMAQHPTANFSENGNGPPGFMHSQHSGHFTPPFPMPFPGFPMAGNQMPMTAQPQRSTELTRYAEPHPRMYPMIPSGSEPLPPPQAQDELNFTPSVSNALVSMPQPSPALFGQQMPMHPHHPPMPSSIDPTKHTCGICGKLRSPRYHYKHPLAPGQLPRPTVCKRCRKEETDSEDESVDSYDRRDYRERSRARSQLRSQSRARSARPKSRARSSSRQGYRKVDFDYYSGRDPEVSSSESDISETYSSRQRRRSRRRSRAPDVEIHRYVDVDRQPRKKIVYVESRSTSHDYSNDEDEGVDVRYIDAPRALIRNRPGTPSTYKKPRYYPEYELPAQEMVERQREYYNGALYVRPRRGRSASRQSSYSQSRPGSRHRIADLDYAYPETMRATQFYEPAQEGRTRARDINDGRSRSRSRFSIDEGAESGWLDPKVESGPRTPMLRRRRSMSNARSRNIATDGAHDERQPQSTKERLSAAQIDGKDSGSDGTPSDDYDWYDSNGMRVRVREI